MTDAELLAPGGIEVQWLVAHGLQKPKMPIEPTLHLNALRSLTLQQISMKNADPANEEEFMSGSLLALPIEIGPAAHRCTGFVLGAFKRPKFVGDVAQKMTMDEVGKLMDAGSDLKAIIMKKPEYQRKNKRANTEPAVQDAFPANEAVEVQLYGRHSLVERRRSSPDDYAFKVSSDSSKPSVDQTPYRYPPRPAEVAEKHLLDMTPDRYSPNEGRREITNQYPAPYSSPDPLLGNSVFEAGNREATGIFGYRYPSSEDDPNEEKYIPFDQQRPELYPGYPSSVRAEEEELLEDSGYLQCGPQQSEDPSGKESGSSEVVRDRKPTGFTWFSSKPEPSAAEKKAAKALKALKAAAKAEAKAEKAEKEKAKFVDIGVALPFHSVNRFRGF
jgi:hypothetical protein